MRTSAWETATEKLLKEIAGEGQYIYGFDEGGVHTIKCFFFFFLAEDFCYSRGIDHHEGIRYEEMQELGS